MASIDLTAGDGHRLAAHVAQPSTGAAPRAAVVVIQEIFGLNAHIRSVADGYAQQGYLAIAPALFDRIERGVELGYAEADMPRARELRGASPTSKALLDIAAAVAHARALGATKVAVVGFCWGGFLAWKSAQAGSGVAVDAAVPYYGGGIPADAAAHPGNPICPVMAHFGKTDPLIALDTVHGFIAAHPEVITHLYDAGHGFNCDARASFDAASAATARERTLAFLAKHLG
jgi:carboxymethylenebutenolidase